MLLRNFASQVFKYPLPIGFALIICIMIFTSFYAALQMKIRSDVIIESVEQQNLHNELLNTMTHAVFRRSLIAVEMLHTDDPFINDELFIKLNELATEFAIARANFKSQDNLSPRIQKLLDTQGHVISINSSIF